jgi:hypothetical protein
MKFIVSDTHAAGRGALNDRNAVDSANGGSHPNAALVNARWKTKALDVSRRRRVCHGCTADSDALLGWIHSELPCERCGVMPCNGNVVEVAA